MGQKVNYSDLQRWIKQEGGLRALEKKYGVKKNQLTYSKARIIAAEELGAPQKLKEQVQRVAAKKSREFSAGVQKTRFEILKKKYPIVIKEGKAYYDIQRLTVKQARELGLQTEMIDKKTRLITLQEPTKQEIKTEYIQASPATILRRRPPKEEPPLSGVGIIPVTTRIGLKQDLQTPIIEREKRIRLLPQYRQTAFIKYVAERQPTFWERQYMKAESKIPEYTKRAETALKVAAPVLEIAPASPFILAKQTKQGQKLIDTLSKTSYGKRFTAGMRGETLERKRFYRFTTGELQKIARNPYRETAKFATGFALFAPKAITGFAAQPGKEKIKSLLYFTPLGLAAIPKAISQSVQKYGVSYTAGQFTAAYLTGKGAFKLAKAGVSRIKTIRLRPTPAKRTEIPVLIKAKGQKALITATAYKQGKSLLVVRKDLGIKFRTKGVDFPSKGTPIIKYGYGVSTKRIDVSGLRLQFKGKKITGFKEIGNTQQSLFKYTGKSPYKKLIGLDITRDKYVKFDPAKAFIRKGQAFIRLEGKTRLLADIKDYKLASQYKLYNLGKAQVLFKKPTITRSYFRGGIQTKLPIYKSIVKTGKLSPPKDLGSPVPTRPGTGQPSILKLKTPSQVLESKTLLAKILYPTYRTNTGKIVAMKSALQDITPKTIKGILKPSKATTKAPRATTFPGIKSAAAPLKMPQLGTGIKGLSIQALTPKTLLVSDIAINQRNIRLPKISLAIQQKQTQKPALMQITKATPISISAILTDLTPDITQRNIKTTKLTQATAQTQLQTSQLQQITMPQITTPAPGIPVLGGELPPPPPIIEPPPPTDETEKRRTTKAEGGYRAKVRHAGKLIGLGKIFPTPDTAAASLKRVIDNTSAASGLIIGVKGKKNPNLSLSQLGQKFKKGKSNNTMIEKKAFRMDTLGEIRGITALAWIKNRRRI